MRRPLAERVIRVYPIATGRRAAARLKALDAASPTAVAAG